MGKNWKIQLNVIYFTLSGLLFVAVLFIAHTSSILQYKYLLVIYFGGMIKCNTCGSFISGRSYKRHKTSIKHTTYEKLRNQVHNPDDVGVLADVADIDEVFDVENILAGNQHTNNLPTTSLTHQITTSTTNLPNKLSTSTTSTSVPSNLTTQAVLHHNEQHQVCTQTLYSYRLSLNVYYVLLFQ
jgi:hypothetical protein